MSQMEESYLEQLHKDERELLETSLKVLKGGGVGFQKKVYARLASLLVTKPYPTLQIFQIHYDNCKFHIGRIFSQALDQFLLENECRSRFISFLANFPIHVLEAILLQRKLLNRLAAQTSRGQIHLALLSRKETILIDLFLDKLAEQWNTCTLTTTPSKEFILHQALQHKQHFVPILCQQIDDISSCIDNISVCNNLLILQLAEKFSNETQTLDQVENLSQSLGAFRLTASPDDLREIHQFFYADFQRLNLILEFLRQYSDIFKTIKVETLLKSIGVMGLIYDYSIDASYVDTFRIIESTYKWQQQSPAIKCVRELELETLEYYTALNIIYDIINFMNPTECAQKIQELNTLLRQIRNISELCALIEDIFELIFLRWEHLDKYVENRDVRIKSRKNSSFLSTDDDEVGVDSTNPVWKPSNVAAVARYGFICRGESLRAICSFLKNFVTKKLHSEDYKNASEHLQLRFQRIVEIIGEALWKYSVLEKIDASILNAAGGEEQQEQQKHELEPTELLLLVQMYTDTIDKTSSDDESRDRCNYASLTRRKVKKRRRATVSGAIITDAAVGNLTMEQCRERANAMANSVSAAVQYNNDSVTKLRAKNMVSLLSDRSIIPKMLGSPENLAIRALALKNFTDVKFIIETFNLQNTPLNRELYFVEQQQQIKQKLAIIFANYQRQETKTCNNNLSDQPLATVDQIKNVAAKGFEMSKIISVVDNFAYAQKIHQSAELKQLLQKYSNNNPQYEFLQQFEERKLNAVIITDLILNLPLNREILTNILMVIKRQQQVTTSFGELKQQLQPEQHTTKEKSQLPREIGAMTFLENMCECMRVLESNNYNNQSTNKIVSSGKSIHELLCSNYYSLKPQNLIVELQRESAFKIIYNKPTEEIKYWDELRSHAFLFQNLKSKYNYYTRFCGYVIQFAQLLRLRQRDECRITTDLLENDPYNVIGELIFEYDMTPLEIEANVSALNLNLVHVIALNICPQISLQNTETIETKSLRITPEKQETILNYISNQNQLLAYILQCIQHYSTELEQHIQLNSEFLMRLLNLPDMDILARLYDDNKMIAALRSDKLNVNTIEGLDSQLMQLKILMVRYGNREPKKVQNERIDKLITKLIQNDPKNIHLAAHINDITLKAKLLYKNFTKLTTTRLAKELIESTLQHKNAEKCIPTSLRHELEETLSDITIYAKVTEVLDFETWPQAYDFGRKTPNKIFEKLLKLQLFKLCYEWCQVVTLAEKFAHQQRSFLATLLDALLELDDDNGGSNEKNCSAPQVNKYLLQILETFPTVACVKLLDEHKEKFRSFELLKYAIDYLEEHAPHESYRNCQISLLIFEQLMQSERRHFWKLLKYPLLIIEQLIMNAKFEILNKVLGVVRKKLLQPDFNKLVGNGAAARTSLCAFCFDKHGNLYDITTKSSSPHKVRYQLGGGSNDAATSTNSAFILLNFNLYQKDHIISNECIDLLLRIYTTKALDYQIYDLNSSSSERFSQITDMQSSLDSLCGAFQMPTKAPARGEWVRDDEASHCMCCRRTAFTMLMRRHHCRRCGRVVCFACSTHRMRIPELYADVDVRICNDCQRLNDEEHQQLRGYRDDAASLEMDSDLLRRRPLSRQRDLDVFKWRLSGNITHDKLLREEFCYEHAPSVALSLSILGYHLGQQKCVELLLYHCRKLEKLIVPNPEVDFELVAKMMNCLAVAAKVRGAPAEVETIREHSEIIISVVQNGCEALLHHSLRKLADSLVQAENWSLALEVHLKCGFSTAGVMAAHGLACLRAGCFDTAREKFSHCMPKLTNEHVNGMIYKRLFHTQTGNNNYENINDNNQPPSSDNEIGCIKRPQRGPALLQEILKLIQSIPFAKPQPETLHRASIIRNSNTSLASLFSRRKEPYIVPTHEPALNLLTTLANLKHIAKGNYDEIGGCVSADVAVAERRQMRGFEESIHYVLTYGSHADILKFLMQQQELAATLKYYLLQNHDPDLFINHIFLVCLRCGQLPTLIELMQTNDGDLLQWRNTLLHTCRFLETQNHLNTLYQLQLLLNDPIRASMTCVKFYSMNCVNFQQLHMNAQHLRNAHLHLQTELESTNWDTMQLESSALSSSNNKLRKNSVNSRRFSNASTVKSTLSSTGFLMQMDARALNGHINTILKQLDVAKFLAKCELEQGKCADNRLITEHLLKQIRIEQSNNTLLPTLFDAAHDKIQICILILLCGKNIEEGFGLAYRIVQHYKLPPMKVYAAAAQFLARNQRLHEVEKLLNCITSNNGISTQDIDDILSIAINSATHSHEPEVKSALDNLTKKIHSVELRISCHIFIGQLKSAYLLANKYERLADIRKILRKAEATNQTHIKKLCDKKLNINNVSPTVTL